MRKIIDGLFENGEIKKYEIEFLLENHLDDKIEYLYEKAVEKLSETYGKRIFLRALIEISSFCYRNCAYCGIRAENKNAVRYRLSDDEIIETAKWGYKNGYRTVVLQGGEDAYFTDEVLVGIIDNIKRECPGIAVTLSLGERSCESYKRLYDAGSDRYLLRHETIDEQLYSTLHKNMSLENRLRCLEDLRQIGYQTGSGFIIGLPGQNYSTLADDLIFLKNFKPHMIGIGPFVPHKDTPLGKYPNGNTRLTLVILSIVRLMLPDVLLPATTALETLEESGKLKGILAGANVVMPNITDKNLREGYKLYDNKKGLDGLSSDSMKEFEGQIEEHGFKLDFSRGDYLDFTEKENIDEVRI